MMDQEAFDINKLPLTEEYKKIKKRRKERQKKKPNKHLMTKKKFKKYLVIDNDRRIS